MALKRYDKLQRYVCGYDFLALAPFAIPFLTARHLEMLGMINTQIGGRDWPQFAALDLLFVQLMGLIATAWTVWRWQHLSVEIGRFEGYLRLLFAASLWFGYLQTGQPLLVIFSAVDMVLGLMLIIGARSSGLSATRAPAR